MQLFKKLLAFHSILFMSLSGYTQKQSFDVVSFTTPKGWQQQQNEGGVQLSVTDKKTGAYAIAIITKATASGATANENFNTDWNKLVKTTVQVTDAPAMQDAAKENGWDIISGTANYTNGAEKGLATLLTATGGGQTASVVLMTNTDKYQTELLAFLNSLSLTKVSQLEAGRPKTVVANNRSSIVGLWTAYLTETSGYMNGVPQYTSGYFRREYVFYGDGTYLFRVKNWSVTTKEILFVYETGTYATNGSKLTITPKTGQGEWWSKAAGGSTKGWGNKVKASTWKLEPVTYNFDLQYFPGTNDTHLILQSAKETEREGRQENNKAIYKPKAFNQSMIDNPPGFKTGFENKTTSVSSPPTTPVNTVTNSPIAGKIWEAQSLEKHGAAYGSMSGFHTGGFWLYQYKFNKDGTYRFVYNAASAVATNPVNILQYETGTYTVNGNSITVTPVSGANEEWSVGKINNGMSAETIRNVLETRIKRLKTTARKLEKTTYPFTVEYWQGNNANALCLKHAQNTVREGSPGQNDQSCFFETTAAKSVILPIENK